MTSPSSTDAMDHIQIAATLTTGLNHRIIATSRGHEIVMDSRKDWGGDDAGPIPPECLVIGLGGCVVNICRIMAAEKQIELLDLQVSITGDIDPSRAFGLKTDNRAGFSQLVLAVAFSSTMSVEEKEAFCQELERRCPLCDTIANQTPCTLKFL